MMHLETQELIRGPIAHAADLHSAIIAIEKVRNEATRRLELKKKSVTIQDTTPTDFQDADFKILREASFIQECLEKGKWHSHLNFDTDYSSIQIAVELAKKFTS